MTEDEKNSCVDVLLDEFDFAFTDCVNEMNGEPTKEETDDILNKFIAAVKDGYATTTA